MLVVGPWCPYTSTASSFWKSIAENLGQTLKVVSAEDPQGAEVVRVVGVTGVPCLVLDRTNLFYGLDISVEDATSFLAQQSPAGV